MARKKKSEETENKAFVALMSGKKLSDAHQKEVREIAEHLIDEFIGAVGYKTWTDRDGWRHLEIESRGEPGPGEPLAGIKDIDGELYLHVEADVMPIPSDRDLIQALMREALELNCRRPAPYCDGIRGTKLVASVNLNLRDLNSPEEYGNSIDNVIVAAYTIDDGLVQKYGGTTRQRSGAVVAGTV